MEDFCLLKRYFIHTTRHKMDLYYYVKNKIINLLSIQILSITFLLLLPSCKDNVVSSMAPGDTTWTYLGLGHEWITSIAVDPTNPNIIYAGSRYEFSDGTPGRFFKSVNGGKTWDTMIVNYGAIYTSIIISPQNSDIIYAASLGIIKSCDAGTTWTEQDNGIRIIPEEVGIEALAMDPKNNKTLYAGAGGPSGGGMYKTTDGGANWNIIGGDSLGDGVISIAINPVDPNIIYAGTAGACFVWKSIDAGHSWKRTGLGENGLIKSICINPTDTEQIFVGTAMQGGVPIWESKDGGNTWKACVQGNQSNVIICNSLVFNPSEPFDLYEGGTGVYNKNCQNCSWVEMNNGLPDSRIDILILDKDFNLYSGLENLESTSTGGIYKQRIIHK